MKHNAPTGLLVATTVNLFNLFVRAYLVENNELTEEKHRDPVRTLTGRESPESVLS